MSNTSSITKWASVAAIAASTLFAAPAAFADQGLKVQIVQKTLKSNHRNDRNVRPITVLRECGSSGYRSNVCHFDVNFNIADARVYDRKSKGSCDEGDEWGLRGNTMWVRDGCRAIFELSSVRFPNSRGQEYGHNDGRGNIPSYPRNGGIRNISHSDQNHAIGLCAREANQQAYRLNAYSAQYRSQPYVDIGRQGRLRVTGSMRVHGPNGFRNRDTVCAIGQNGRVQRFNFD
ncbi:DUF3011 domain-containing protein [Hirschia baltica]|uniref:DUF3011 domain-containing protein n=1 Tax=Hirschia baltica (strain ATCC 49814 / DSM 5838 / IFAM 1418) TaxID=582402 RepID=C6XLD3_HIRBI|nr:DUF3011 domain-containing protein [Hirschia baltica]ACT59732.1 hypothetical protein Hbal_2049 [Hirschia baltica ATCC 49814]